MTNALPQIIANDVTSPRQRRYLRLPQIIGPSGFLPISRSTFWAGVKDGKFPKSYKISARVTVWLEEDIFALLEKIENGEMR